jgi:AraC-like DNA-binding protein
MLLAADKLTHFDNPISVIARSLGYESEPAFSTALKRVMNCSPRECRGSRITAPPSQSEGNAAARADIVYPANLIARNECRPCGACRVLADPPVV